MERLTINRRLLRTASNLACIPIKHEQQTGVSWCWAASALMMVPDPQATQLTLVSNFLFPTPPTNCGTTECVTSVLKKSTSSTDHPLCLSCNQNLLDRLTNNPGYYVEIHHPTISPAFTAIAGNINNGKPVEAYCSHYENAHFLVIYGVFSIFALKNTYDFVMIADPHEKGVGVCEYRAFRKKGAYHRRSRDYNWTRSFW